MQGWERAVNTLSVQRPQLHNPNRRKIEEKGETSRIQTRKEQLRLTLDTWSRFEAAKRAPWQCRGLHHLCKFLEP